MIDLLGFWTAVTLIVAPTILLVYYLVESLISKETYSLTKGSATWRPFGCRWDSMWQVAYRKDLEIPLVFAVVVAVAASFFTLIAANFMVDCDTGEAIPFIKAVADMALVIAPVCNYIAAPLLFVITYRLTLRPLLVKAFALKTKIDKM